MIKLCDKNEKEALIKYIGDDFGKCIYLYLDLKKYGFIDNENVKVYAEHINDTYSLVAVLYYDCLHLYSKLNDFNSAYLVSFINKINPKSIFSTEFIYEIILKNFNTKFTYHILNVLKYDKKVEMDFSDVDAKFEYAEREDLEEAAKLVLNDEVFKDSYTLDNLIKQFMQRYDDKYSTFYVIRKDGVIAAFACSGAEYEDIAVGNIVVVNKNYRGRKYGKIMLNGMYNDLVDKGYTAFTFPANDRTCELQIGLGLKHIGKICKMTRN